MPDLPSPHSVHPIDRTLAAIDHATDDWSVSRDAMRWQPEPPENDDSQAVLAPEMDLAEVRDNFRLTWIAFTEARFDETGQVLPEQSGGLCLDRPPGRTREAARSVSTFIVSEWVLMPDGSTVQRAVGRFDGGGAPEPL